MNGLDNIINKIISDAEAEAAVIIAEAEAEASSILEQYRAQAAIESNKVIEIANHNATAKEARMQSVAELEGRKQNLAMKQEMISVAFDLALQKLVNLPKDQYIKLLAKLAADATQTKDEEVLFSAADREAVGNDVVAEANRLCGGSLKLAPDTRPISGGVILKKGLMELNCDLKNQVGMLKEELAREIADTLFA